MALVIKTTGVEEYLDASGEAHIKALILGEASAGKTRSASFWPAPIFADCERGRMSLADRAVPYADIDSSNKMDALLRMLEVECSMRAPAERKYKTLVIDTIDSFQKVVVAEILRAGRKEALSGYQDWGLLDAKMNGFLARLQRLSMNVVVNCHVQTTQDGDNGPLLWEPRLQGSVRKQIAGDFDLVGYMGTNYAAVNGQRELRRSVEWHPRPNFPILKDRSGQLPRFTDVVFTDDDYANLFATMFGSDYFEGLGEGQFVEELATDDPTAPDVVAPHAGGPVAAKASTTKPPAATTAKQADVKAATPKAEPAPIPAPRTRAQPNVPPAKRAQPRQAPHQPPQPAAPAQAATPAPTQPQPVTGGATQARNPLVPAFEEGKTTPAMQVVEDPDLDDAGPDRGVEADLRAGAGLDVPRMGEVDGPTMEEAVATVAEVLGGEVVPVEEPPAPTPGLPESQGDAAAPAAAATPAPRTCGQARKNSTTDPVPGCGKPLVDLTQVERDLVNISLIKTKTFLCTDCYEKWQAARS